MFLLWLGEQITSRGIGNGTSLIIMAGIVAADAAVLHPAVRRRRVRVRSGLTIFAMVLLVIGMILFISFMERATRRLLIQYPKRPTQNGMMQADRSHLPLRSTRRV
jgi:preprotein translocase subunit SecY